MSQNIQYTDKFICRDCTKFSRLDLTDKGRILLPEAVEEKIYAQGYFPGREDIMAFSVKNPRLNIEAIVGVLEFTMPPGFVCIPPWLMEYLEVHDRNSVVITFKTNIPRAQNVVFQPYEESFNEIYNPQAILQYHLRDYPFLNYGSIVVFNFNGKDYHVKILDTQPAHQIQIYRTSPTYSIQDPMEQFKHRWNDSDTDSSEGDEIIKIKGKNLNGQEFEQTKIKKNEKIKVSTLEQRQAERKKNPNSFRTIEVIQGHEVAPEKPKEEVPKITKSNFVGKAHFTEKTKTNKNANIYNDPNVGTPVPVAPQSRFTGTARTLGGNKIEEPVAKVPAPLDLPVKDDKPAKVDYFTGKGRTRVDPVFQPEPEENPLGQAQETESSTRFKGKGRTIE